MKGKTLYLVIFKEKMCFHHGKYKPSYALDYVDMTIIAVYPIWSLEVLRDAEGIQKHRTQSKSWKSKCFFSNMKGNTFVLTGPLFSCGLKMHVEVLRVSEF